MQTRSKTLSAGALVAALGGAATIGAMAMMVDLTKADMIGQVCYYLLTAVMFFAVAGGFKSNGQWPVELMIVMNFVVIGLLIVGAILSVFDIWVMIGLLVMAVFVLSTVLTCLSSSVWFGSVNA
ncbi:MAG: hypothetical protein ACI4Q9_04475 [Candidatus Methanomethylophilaceae archaeon]